MKIMLYFKSESGYGELSLLRHLEKMRLHRIVPRSYIFAHLLFSSYKCLVFCRGTTSHYNYQTYRINVVGCGGQFAVIILVSKESNVYLESTIQTIASYSDIASYCFYNSIISDVYAYFYIYIFFF